MVPEFWDLSDDMYFFKIIKSFDSKTVIYLEYGTSHYDDYQNMR